MKIKFSLFILIVVFLTSITFAAHIITTSTGTTSYSINETIMTTFNISVNNTDAGEASNITFVNITLPSQFTFNATTNGTSATKSVFTNISNILSWTNTTGYIVNGSETIYFWFNAIVSTPGTYNITVETVNITGTYPTNISVEVNDTTNPTAFIGTKPINAYNSSSANVTFDIKCNDTYATNNLVLYGNWSGSGWHTNQTNASANNNSYWNITVTGIADGTYKWTAYCNDSAGNSDWDAANRTLTVDTTPPTASFGTNTINASVLINRTTTFDIKCNDTLSLPNTIQLWGNWNGTWAANNTNNSAINNIFSNITVNFSTDGTFTWAVWCNDSAGNGAWTTTNKTFTIGANPTATFGTVPINAYNSSSANVVFGLKCSDAHNVDTMQLWGNWSGSWAANNTNSSGLVNNTFSNISITNLADGTYKWAVYCNDSDSNFDWTDTNRTLIIDTTNPTASASCTPRDLRNGEPTTCTCSGADTTSGIYTKTANSVVDTSSLSGTQTYTCTVTDYAGNSASATATYVVTDGGGSSLPSGGTSTTFWTAGTHTVTNEQFAESFTKEVSVKQRLKINIGTQEHHVGLTGITATTATIEIASDPQTATLSIGDERKFEVTDDDYYDIFVKLNSITNSKANITIKSINELITEQSITKEDTKEQESTAIKTKETTTPKVYLWTTGIIAAIVIIVLIILYPKKKKR